MANETPQQINQLTEGFKGLQEAINGVNKAIPDFSDGLQAGLQAVAKEMPNVVDSLIKLNEENRRLTAEGGKPKDILSQLVSATLNWNTAISIGTTLLISYGGEIIKWAANLFKGETSISALTKSLKDQKIIMDALIQTRLVGEKAAQSSLTTLDLLYDSSQNHNSSLKEQKDSVALLKEQWPSTFKNLSDEAILTGKAANAYKNLRNEIIATAQVEASKKKITDNTVRQIDNEQKFNKEKAKNINLLQEEAKAKKALNELLPSDDKSNLDNALSGLVMSDTNMLQQYTDDLNNKTKAREKSDKILSDINTDNILLKEQNSTLKKNINHLTKKFGLKVLNNDNEVTNRTTSKSTVPQHDHVAKEQFNLEATTLNLSKQAEVDYAASLDRMAKLTMDAFSQELADTDEHYRQLEEKYKNYLDKYEGMSKSEKQKHAQEHAAVQQAQSQLEHEHAAARLQVTEKFNKENAAKILQAQNELQNLKIKSMQEGDAKEIAQLQQQQTETNQQLDAADAETLERITKLHKNITDAKNPNDAAALQKQLDAQYQILNLNCEKREQLEQQTATAIRKIRQDDDQKKRTDKDQKAIDGAKSPAEKLAAQKQLINDTYAYEAQQAQGNSKKLQDIEEKRVAAITALERDAQQARKDFTLQMAQKVSDTAFNLIKSGIQSQSDAKIKQLESNKAAELSNTSLTNTQKKAIEDKYKQKEGQEKVKAFKAEQKAQIAQAVINGALAITKATSQTGVLAPFVVPGIIAETVLQIATIAKQKPPQYAKGGHFVSDGRGALLPGYSRTDNTNAYLRSGEAVVVSEAMRNPWARNLVSAINVMHGGRDFSVTNPGRGYAIGGIFTDGGNANRYYSQPVHNQQDLANTLAYKMINNFPPIYVDVKDVNNQQNILAQTVNRVNL